MLWKELRNLHQKKINNLWIQVLVDLSNRNVEFTNKYLIDLLEWISDSDNSLLEVINCKLPKAAAQLGEFISHIDVIKSNDKSCSNKNEAVLKIIEIDRKNDLSHFVTYESLLMHLENLIKDHKNCILIIGLEVCYFNQMTHNNFNIWHYR